MRGAPGFGTKPWRASEAPGRRSPAPRGGHGAGRAPETPPCGSAPRPPGGCGDQRGRTQPGQWKGGRRNYQGRVGCFKQNLIWCKKWNWDLARATMLPALSLEKRPFSQDRKSKALHFIWKRPEGDFTLSNGIGSVFPHAWGKPRASTDSAASCTTGTRSSPGLRTLFHHEALPIPHAQIPLGLEPLFSHTRGA